MLAAVDPVDDGGIEGPVALANVGEGAAAATVGMVEGGDGRDGGDGGVSASREGGEGGVDAAALQPRVSEARDEAWLQCGQVLNGAKPANRRWEACTGEGEGGASPTE